jgi:hypothetical protein
MAADNHVIDATLQVAARETNAVETSHAGAAPL